jgi:Domain of unknown function (DUF4407)
MGWPEKIAELALEQVGEIAKHVAELVYYAPPEYQGQLKLIGVVLSYVGVTVVCVLLLYKLYLVGQSGVERVRKSVTALADLTGRLLHSSFTAVFEQAIPAMFKAQTYTEFLEWCSMTDREAINRFEVGTRPRLVQQLFGFMVLLASTYAAIAFACAIGFVLVKENGSPSLYQWIGVVVMAGVFACFIGAFDRSIAGAPRLFRLPTKKSGADRSNLSWTKRVYWLLMDLATPENLRGCAMMLVRLAVCWMSASFIANVLAVWLFQTSIERRIDSQVRQELDASLPAKLTDVPTDKLLVVASPECEHLRDISKDVEASIKKETDIRFKNGGEKGSFNGPNYKALIAQRNALLSQIKTSCHVEKESDEVALQKAKNAKERLDQADKRDDERAAEFKKRAVLDLGAGMEHVKNVPGYTMLYWLLFSLEMLVLTTKLILSSSYDEAVENFERNRQQLVA